MTIVTEPKPHIRMFYVAMSKSEPHRGQASCVDEGDDKLVKEFFRDYAGREIRHVDGAEMKRLMTN